MTVAVMMMAVVMVTEAVMMMVVVMAMATVAAMIVVVVMMVMVTVAVMTMVMVTVAAAALMTANFALRGGCGGGGGGGQLVPAGEGRHQQQHSVCRSSAWHEAALGQQQPVTACQHWSTCKCSQGLVSGCMVTGEHEGWRWGATSQQWQCQPGMACSTMRVKGPGPVATAGH